MTAPTPAADEPYTPTTEDVRDVYTDWHATCEPEISPEESRRARAPEFDRWLARHDAEVKVQALREAAEAAVALGIVSGSHVAVGDRAATWLDARADRIERGASRG
ncbi:MAG: hypothetical protein ACO1ON_12950 [Nocardioides sp.]